MKQIIKDSWIFPKDDEAIIQLSDSKGAVISGVTVVAGTPKEAARILRKRMKGNRIKRSLKQRILWPTRGVWLHLVFIAFLVGKLRGIRG